MNEPKKSLGQHWLNDQDILSDIVISADVKSSDHVIEIGPGQGSLTEILINTGAKVTAVEYDPELLPFLKSRFSGASNNLQILQQDILKYNFDSIEGGYKIVANIPYYLTSHLLRIISDTKNKPKVAALLMQKEVAERVCAKSGSMSILSVAVQTEYQATLGVFVPSKCFVPPPKVDSQLLLLTKRPVPLIPESERKLFMKLVKSGFSAKRKTLRNTLSAGLLISKEQAEDFLSASNIDPGKRAESLSLGQWQSLFTTFKSYQE